MNVNMIIPHVKKKSRFRSADGGTGGGRVCVGGGGETEKDKNTPACLL